jgi:protein gp37
LELTLHEDRLDPPLGRNKSTVYFAGSMADLFHEGVPDAFVDRMLAVIRQTPRHTDRLLAQLFVPTSAPTS